MSPRVREVYASVLSERNGNLLHKLRSILRAEGMRISRYSKARIRHTKKGGEIQCQRKEKSPKD